MLEQKTADQLTEVLTNVEMCHVTDRVIFDNDGEPITKVEITFNGMDAYKTWRDFINAVRIGALLKLVEDDEPYTRGDREDKCPITLLRYARQHEKEHGHDTLIYGNFCECPTCGDHAHYVGNRTMLRHNRTWDEDVTVEIEFD